MGNADSACSVLLRAALRPPSARRLQLGEHRAAFEVLKAAAEKIEAEETEPYTTYKLVQAFKGNHINLSSSSAVGAVLLLTVPFKAGLPTFFQCERRAFL